MPVQMYTDSDASSKQEVRKFWQLFSILFLAIAIPLTLVALKLFLDFRSSADVDPNPEEVIISNVSDTSVTISFMTNGDPVKTSIKYGVPGDLSNESFFDARADDGTESFNLHYHKLSNLAPGQAYEFRITIGATDFPNADAAFENNFNTLSSIVDISTPRPVNGIINGSNFKDGVVYVHLTDGSANSMVVSSLVPETTGAYSIELGNAWKKDGTEFTEATDIVVFGSVYSQGRGYTSSPISEEFMPEITLATNIPNYDPNSLNYVTGDIDIVPSDTSTPTPEVTPESTPIQTPTPEVTPESTPIPTPTPTPIPVAKLSVSNLDNNDSVIPGGVILGDAEPNSTVEFSVDNSDIGSTFAESTGSWQFTLPKSLPPGQSNLIITNNEQSISYSIKVKSLDDLPDTALSDYTPYIIGAIIVVFGIYLTNWIKGNRRWGEGEIDPLDL